MQSSLSPTAAQGLAQRYATLTLEMLALYLDLYQRCQLWILAEPHKAQDEKFRSGLSEVALLASRRCGRASQTIRMRGADFASAELSAYDPECLVAVLNGLCESFVQFTGVGRRSDVGDLVVAEPGALVEQLAADAGEWLHSVGPSVSPEFMSHLVSFAPATP